MLVVRVLLPKGDLHGRLLPKYLRRSRLARTGRRGATSEIARVALPSGDLIWVRIRAAEQVAVGKPGAGPADVGLGERAALAVEALRLPGFTETVRGVVASVRQALDEHRPDSLTVEFAIEITARSGALVSVLADVGGTAQVKVTASWDRRDAALSARRDEEPDLE
jgi:Trypsin-co-occurring domain 1